MPLQTPPSPDPTDRLDDIRFPALLALAAFCLFWTQVIYMFNGFGYPDPWIDWLPAFASLAFCLSSIGFWRIRHNTRYTWSLGALICASSIVAYLHLKQAMFPPWDFDKQFDRMIQYGQWLPIAGFGFVALLTHSVADLAKARGESGLQSQLIKARNWTLITLISVFVGLPLGLLLLNHLAPSAIYQALFAAICIGGCLLTMQFHLYMCLTSMAMPSLKANQERPSLPTNR